MSYDILTDLNIPGSPTTYTHGQIYFMEGVYNLSGFLSTLIISFMIIALVNAGNIEGSAWAQLLGLGIILWILFRLVNDLIVLGKTEFLVVETLGSFSHLQIGGWVLVTGKGIISKIPPGGRATLERSERSLYGGSDDPNSELDFDGASAPVKASVWFRVGVQEGVDEGMDGELRLKRAILRFVYLFDDPFSRFNQFVDAIVRPILENKSIDEARTAKVADSVNRKLKTPPVEQALKFFSISLVDDRPFVLADIQMSDAIQDIRAGRLRAKVAADNQRVEAKGFADAILTLAKVGLKSGEKPTEEQVKAARQQLITLKGLEAIEGVDNLNLLGSGGMQGVLATLDIGSK